MVMEGDFIELVNTRCNVQMMCCGPVHLKPV